jgi:hypothetical protein
MHPALLCSGTWEMGKDRLRGRLVASLLRIGDEGVRNGDEKWG